MARCNLNHNRWTTEQNEWLKKNCQQHYKKQLTELFNREFGKEISRNALWHQCEKLGIKIKRKRELKHYLRKGVSFNALPIGSERCDIRRGHILVKVANPNVWKYKHHIEWERYHNKPVPKGGLLIFLDGDKTNFGKGNLVLVDQSELTCLNKKKLWEYHNDLRASVVLLAKLEMKIKKIDEHRR